MTDSQTSPIDCHWCRRGEPAPMAHCGLLQELTGLTHSPHCAVNHDACVACQRWYPPTAQHLNPVVASLLYTLSTQLLATDCSTEKAAELRLFALSSIPHDYDATPVAEQVHEQRNTQIPDIGQLIPRPRHRYGAPLQEWAVAVTTAPRKHATLDNCLASMLTAGWDRPRIIVDGEVTLSEQWNHLPVTQRNPQIGAWPSYYLTLIELLMRQPQADAYMIVQDDVVFFQHPALRRYLESVLWPDPEGGIVSLFCSRAYSQSTPGWHRLDEQMIWGGQALIFSKETVIRLLADPQIVCHRFSEGRIGLTHIDSLIGRWAYETQTPVYVTSPSLSQHIGHVSSLWDNSKAFINRSAAAFAGNDSPVDE